MNDTHTHTHTYIYIYILQQIGRGKLCQNTTLFVSYLLCWRRHVSATVGHLQVTKIYNDENYTEYDHSMGVYSKLSTRSRRLYCTYWANIISYKQSSSFLLVQEVKEYAGRGCEDITPVIFASALNRHELHVTTILPRRNGPRYHFGLGGHLSRSQCANYKTHLWVRR